VSDRIAIAGAGAIAVGLARAAAPHLSDGVVLWARSPESAERAAAALEGAAEVTGDMAGLAGATTVIESVVEDLAVKSALLAKLGELAADDAVIATTTSALSVEALARASGRPDRFAGLHVFNPVDRMELVELVFPTAASDATRERMRTLCTTLGKTAVEMPDAPGFVVNRLLFPYLFSAVELMDERGLDPQAIDDCMRLGAGHPMGPLAVLDFVGLDVAAAIGDAIGVEPPARVRELIAQGRLGRKAGAGFHEYDG
jgi:3-hydroxybutyryl-CoA dehydrogenase